MSKKDPRKLKAAEPVPKVTSVDHAVNLITAYIDTKTYPVELVELIGFFRLGPMAIDKYILVDALREMGMDITHCFIEFSPGQSNHHFGEDYRFDDGNHIITVWHYVTQQYSKHTMAIVTRREGNPLLEGKEYRYG